MSKQFTLPYEGGLAEETLSGGILHNYEKIWTDIYPEARPASVAVADLISASINKCKGRLFRLGLTTGATPAALYEELARRYEAGELSFRNVEVISIDEYYPASGDEAQSRNHRLHEALLDRVDILPENVHIPDPTVPSDRISEYCSEFDKLARGLDLLVIGIGEDGQVGFNESGSNETTRTRTVRLSYSSRKRQSRNFNHDIAVTPQSAITMGIGTMMTADHIILMAWGEDKAKAVKAIAEGEITTTCPASLLQRHQHIRFFVDDTAGSLLTRVVAPWLVGPCNWTPKLRRKAVVWLCQTVGKPILKLTDQDYLENSLGELLEKYGSFDKINIEVFNDLQHTITGWPGGKPNADDSTRPVPVAPFPKTILIFSPHPDDDVISMGGTFIRMVSQGHNVHVAYETSGDVAVHDDVVLQQLDAAYQLGLADRFDEVKALIDSKVPGEPEPRALLNLKAAIRRSEARAAVRSFGLDDKKNAHFLNLPFYESGGIKKNPCTQVDIDIIKKLIRELKPQMIFMAGDLADPHGTHRVCTEAALLAVEQLKAEGEKWLSDTHIWLYRGAWMEWELGRVDMAVPLSPDEVVKKRHAIFRHLSQKDIVPFPGEDPREFWQRAEERTQNTAQLYDKLGMAEYQAIEVFLKLC
ncbi:MAG: glucosamine-6-phosphate deaminase [Bacteroidales bacterium]|nr:glucosamine-6-phosphate deaminase [Bacteroidales bacterium]